MGEVNLKSIKLEPEFRGNQSKGQSRAQGSGENQSSSDLLHEAQPPVDDTSPSVSHLCPAPICRQFWKSGNYQDAFATKSPVQNSGNYLHIHPRFLHSNATSHKWAFGAVAELLDNAIDEIQNGATFVIVDKISNPRDGTPALLIKDDGGGMKPEVIRQCMSFGFSDKQSAIGQYGNGFKTSTMRLGSDVVVFSRHRGNREVTQSVGLLSYTYMMQTGLDRIVVPLADYRLNKLTRKFEPLHGAVHIQSNLSVLLQWSPYSTEAELLKQFDDIGDHGTKVIVYNLWHADDGALEFDFDTNPEDIKLRDFDCPETVKHKKSARMIENHIGSQYRYSLRVYLSILYLRIPQNFRIVLRGQAVLHHNIADDLKFIEYILYKPQMGKSSEGQVVTTIGFLKEAPWINIHGFSVYHKNRLVLPFWQVVRYANSRGRGVVGILEADFVQPTHNKQDFEKTSLFQKLESRLKEMTLEYWDFHCGLIGYQVKKKLPSQHVLSDAPKIVNQTSGILDNSLNIGSQTTFQTHRPTGSQTAVQPHATGVKRSHHDMSLEDGGVNTGLGIGANIVDAGNSVSIQSSPSTTNGQHEKESILIQNRKLHERYKEHEKKVKELEDKVFQLKKGLVEAQREYDMMLKELDSLNTTKTEKNAM